VTEGQDLLGTGLDTGRRISVFQTCVVTENTLFDLRMESAGVAVGRNTERTGDHAGPAAHADSGIVDNCPFPGLGVGIDKA
jgi:hypothetical protein